MISAFVFAMWIVQSLLFFYPKSQASSLLLCTDRFVSYPVRNPEDQFSCFVAQLFRIGSLKMALYLSLSDSSDPYTSYCSISSSPDICGPYIWSGSGRNAKGSAPSSSPELPRIASPSSCMTSLFTHNASNNADYKVTMSYNTFV